MHGAIQAPETQNPPYQGGPVSRQSRGISRYSAVPILPEKLNRCKSHFWLWRSFALRAVRRDLFPNGEAMSVLAEQFHAAADSGRTHAQLVEVT